jgi:hypothetical protein
MPSVSIATSRLRIEVAHALFGVHHEHFLHHRRRRRHSPRCRLSRRAPLSRRLRATSLYWRVQNCTVELGTDACLNWASHFQYGRVMKRVPRCLSVNWLSGALERAVRVMARGYEPSHHYMRGPGPKTRAKEAHRTKVTSSARGADRA